jgi:2-oxoglutarate ferredoxin oxidoreductase subunit gamma
LGLVYVWGSSGVSEGRVLDLMMSGIGGQGVQLCARTFAAGLDSDGQHVMLSNYYDGAMRGGRTEATIIASDDPIAGMPALVPSVGAAILLHNQFFEFVAPKLRPGSNVVVESSLAPPASELSGHSVVAIPGVDSATELGNPLTAGFVVLGAFAALLEVVAHDSLVSAMRSLVPSYRTQHLESNELALERGAELGRQARADGASGLVNS